MRASWNACSASVGIDESLSSSSLRVEVGSVRLAATRRCVPTAQALLRHANPSTTLDIYTRVRGDQAARLERMRDALGG
jgi:integrase